MDTSALYTATLQCLASADNRYYTATITQTQQISDGYSRKTMRYELQMSHAPEVVILQYVPPGSTGSATALRFAAAGASVVLGDIQAGASAEVATELDGDAVYRLCDVAKEDDASEPVDTAKAAL